MLVTLSGIVTLDKPMHPEKTEGQMLFRLEENSSSVRSVQSENSPLAKPRTSAKFNAPESTMVLLTAQPSTNLMPGSVSSSYSELLQPRKAETPRLTRPSGIETLESPVHLLKASAPMVLTLWAISTLAIPLHLRNAL